MWVTKWLCVCVCVALNSSTDAETDTRSQNTEHKQSRNKQHEQKWLQSVSQVIYQSISQPVSQSIINLLTSNIMNKIKQITREQQWVRGSLNLTQTCELDFTSKLFGLYFKFKSPSGQSVSNDLTRLLMIVILIITLFKRSQMTGLLSPKLISTSHKLHCKSLVGCNYPLLGPSSTIFPHPLLGFSSKILQKQY